MEVTINKEELYLIIKQAVKEVLEEEKIDFFFKNLPSISSKEMEDINSTYGSPSQDKDIVFSETIEI